jgi:hypothetical protein
MKVSMWYAVEERLPDESGYYLAFRGMSFGDDSTETSYYYFNKHTGNWQKYETNSSHISTEAIRFWTDADPWTWYDKSMEDGAAPRVRKKIAISPTEQVAFEDLQEAIKRFQVICELTR